MVISLIGMSGSGKSYWAEKLARRGFKRFCFDALITDRLSNELRRENNRSLTLGEWMGFPFQDGYLEKEKLYLFHEKQLMAEILDWIAENGCAGPDKNIVLDTTGSVIYTGDDLLDRLRSLTTIVYFAVPAVIREAMLRQYLSNPRPVLWRGLFRIDPGETVDEALVRSYNALLDSREALYRALADIEIDYFKRNSPDFRISDFLEIVANPVKK
ncbi:MAG TPA: hypothetical protein VEF34_17065 [Syntrophobacteraceae bacterium]|nr:hypothetical protein [Syntrophobacteraceae bacterium]